MSRVEGAKIGLGGKVESMCDMLSLSKNPWNGNLGSWIGWAVRFRHGGLSLGVESIGSNQSLGVARGR